MRYLHFCYRYVLLVCFIALWGVQKVDGQGIRKHYTQLSEAERAAYEEALDMLYSLGVVEQFPDIHADPDQDGVNGNNFNGPDTDSQIHRVLLFLSWHRQFTAEFEQELQAIDPKLSIPFWDWTGDLDPAGVNSRSALGPLWSNDQIAALGWTKSLIGKYENAQNLGRDLAGPLPTLSQKQNLLNSQVFNSFGNFRVELENVLHDPPHGWVGGEMQDMYFSPRDPTFFIHHSTIDYLWQLWTEKGNTVEFAATSMPTFDGAVSGFPSVDPDNIRNTVTQMGVFFGNPKLSHIRLHDYTVNNDHLDNENFVYPDTIIVDPTFQVSNGAVAEIHSCEAVVLKPGFSIPAGSRVKIGTDAFCQSGGAVAQVVVLEEEIIPQASAVPDRVTLKGFPNPFRESFTFQFSLPAEETVSLDLMDGLGRVVATPMPRQPKAQGEHDLLVNTHGLGPGIYTAVLLLHDSRQRYVLRVVKAN